MSPDIIRIIAVEAHRRRSGLCPVLIHSLGTGHSFDIRPAADGFVDLTSGLTVQVSGDQLRLRELDTTIDLQLAGDIGFEGCDHASGELFSGRASGGASVTVYDDAGLNYFQFAVVTEEGRP
jgi:hypothetical protein